MPAFKEDGCFWMTHSRYYYQWIGGLPFAPHVYWNVVTENDIIPVRTHGYKNLKSAQQQIKKYIADIKEYRLIHVETKEEYEIEKRRTILMISRNSPIDTLSSEVRTY